MNNVSLADSQFASAKIHAMPVVDQAVIDALETDATEATRSRADLARVAKAAADFVTFGPAKAKDAILGLAAADRRLDEIHLRLLAAIMPSISGESGLCWSQYDRLAAIVGWSVKTVRNSCSELERWGYIVRTDPRRANSRGISKTMDTALMPAGHDAWQALRDTTSSVDAVIRLADELNRQHRNRPRARPQRGDIKRPSETMNVPQPGTLKQTNVPHRGTLDQLNVPTGTFVVQDSISTLIGTSPSPDRSPSLGAALPAALSDEKPDWIAVIRGAGVPIDERWREIAVLAGLADHDLLAALREFVGYWLSQGERMSDADWLKRWHRHCHKVAQRGSTAAPAIAAPPLTHDEKRADWLANSEYGREAVRSMGRERAARFFDEKISKVNTAFEGLPTGRGPFRPAAKLASLGFGELIDGAVGNRLLEAVPEATVADVIEAAEAVARARHGVTVAVAMPLLRREVVLVAADRREPGARAAYWIPAAAHADRPELVLDDATRAMAYAQDFANEDGLETWLAENHPRPLAGSELRNAIKEWIAAEIAAAERRRVERDAEIAADPLAALFAWGPERIETTGWDRRVQAASLVDKLGYRFGSPTIDRDFEEWLTKHHAGSRIVGQRFLDELRTFVDERMGGRR